jgi:hypothetical protein
LESPSTNNAPAGAPGAAAAKDEFWAFNPQQPPPVSGQNNDDTSLDELLALYQTAQDAPVAAPFAPMGEPDSYPGFADFGGDAGGGFGFGDPATDQPFGAPAPGAFGAAHADPFGAPAPDAFGAAHADPFGAPAPDAFGAAHADPFGAPAGNAFGAPATDAFGAGGFDFNAAPAFGEAPQGADPFGGLPSAHPEGEFSFGGDAGGLANLAGAHDQPPFGADTADHTSFGFDAAGTDPFGMPAAHDHAASPAGGADAFGGSDPFGGADPFAAPLVAPAGGHTDFGGLDDLFGGDAGTVFPPLEVAGTAAAVPADAVHPPAAPVEELEEFVPDDDAPLFPPLSEAAAFPAFETTPVHEPIGELGTLEDDLFGGDMGPVFAAYEEPASATLEHHATIAAPEDDLFGGDSGPVYGAFEEAPLIMAFDEPVAHEAVHPEAAIDFTQAFPEAAVIPVVEPTPPPEPLARAAVHEPAAAALPVVEIPSFAKQASASALPGVSLDSAAVAALTGQEVGVRSLDERTAVNQQVTHVVGAVARQLDESQAKLANLYAELQRAAVRRASVGEINDITAELGRTRALLGEGSETYKQALYLRQVADAYLHLLQEL